MHTFKNNIEVNTVYYRDNIEIRNNAVIVNHSEGRVVYTNGGGAGDYQYYLKDHLGNIRLSISDKNNDGKATTTEVINENHYYPFGLKMEGDWNSNNTAAPEVSNQYNGKEWVNDLDLGMNDYGARWYDPTVARWSSVDPLAEMRLGLSPYNYVQNNPLIRIDPTGMLDDYIFNERGEYVDKIPTNEPDRIVIQNSQTCKVECIAILNDQKYDGKNIEKENGQYNKVFIINPSNVESVIHGSGVWYTNENKVIYAEREGRPRGDKSILSGVSKGNLDFVGKANAVPIVRAFYLVEGTGKAYNGKDYGNFLFGVATNQLGMNRPLQIFGSQINNILNSKSDNPGLEYHFWDSIEDQKAIEDGYYYIYLNNY